MRRHAEHPQTATVVGERTRGEETPAGTSNHPTQRRGKNPRNLPARDAHRRHKTTRLAVQNHHRTPTPMVHATLSIFAGTTAGTVSLL